MILKFKKLLVSLVLPLFFLACTTLQKNVETMDNILNITWVGKTAPGFNQDILIAKERLNNFLVDHGWQPIKENLIKEYIHYETKELFDSNLIRLSSSSLQEVPKTYVAVGDQRLLRVISWQSYQEVFPKNNHEDYIDLLVHEMAHIFHSNLVGDEKMGPVWFFEGFAILAANQYIKAPKLAENEVSEILESKKRGNYEKYAYILREFIKKHTLKQMVEKACLNESEFLSWLK